MLYNELYIFNLLDCTLKPLLPKFFSLPYPSLYGSPPSTSANVVVVAPSPQRMLQSCVAKVCSQRRKTNLWCHLWKMSLEWLSNTGFHCDVLLVCLLKHTVLAERAFSLLPCLALLQIWHKCKCVWSANWGLLSTYNKGERTEIKGNIKACRGAPLTISCSLWQWHCWLL